MGAWIVECTSDVLSKPSKWLLQIYILKKKLLTKKKQVIRVKNKAMKS